MYSNYLIKIYGDTDYNIPLTFVDEKTYKCTLSVLDLDSYRDANGVLHRTAILQVPHCTFGTRSLTNTQMDELWANIRSRYINIMEKKVRASIYVPESDSYYSGTFYVPDTEMTISHISDGVIKYEPVTFEFIGYGETTV